MLMPMNEPSQHTISAAKTGPLPESLTEDAFLGGKLKILQPEKGYRAGIDSVFLAATIPCVAGDTLFEPGIGTGVAALCTIVRNPAIHITGIEVMARHALLAEENARRNGYAHSVHVIHADVKDALHKDLASMPHHGSFSHAFANPPYFEKGKATPSPNLLKESSHNFGSKELELWIKVMRLMVGLRGTVTLVHRADVLGRILTCMEPHFGDIRVAPLYAREGTVASRVIVQGVKGSRAPLQLLPGLVLHGEGSSFTPDAQAILRDGAGWYLR